MKTEDQSTESIVAAIKAIAQHQSTIVAHHAECVADAEKFKSALQGLAGKNPEAVKQFFDNGDDGLNVVIHSERIAGYYTHGALGYVEDPEFSNYISALASKRIERCDQRSK